MIAITLGSIVKRLAHWPLTGEIIGSNPFDGNFMSSNSMNSSTIYSGKTRLKPLVGWNLLLYCADCFGIFVITF